jgi:hypothetical protein
MKKGLIIWVVIGIIIISAVLFLLNNMHKETINNIGLENDSINLTANEEINQSIEEVYDPYNLSNSICNRLPTSSEFGSDDTYYCLAVVNHNSSFCEKMGSDIEVSGNLEDFNNPDELNDETPKNICLAISTEDSSYCKKVSRLDAKKMCYNVLAQTSVNINFCSDIDYDKNDKQQCYFNFVNALYWEDKSEKITTEDCDKVGLNGGNQDEKTCLAFKSRDVSLCGSNKNCLTFFPQEMSFCNGVTFKDEEECIRDRAMVNEDISICETLSEQTRRDDCYGDFSSHIQPSTIICDKIIGIERRRGCYVDAAINLAKII